MRNGLSLWLLMWMFMPVSAHAEALVGGVNPGYHEQPAWFKESFLDLREDLAEAKSADKRLLLYFYQDGCPYCAKLLQDNFGQKAVAEKTRRNFDVIAINMWGDRELIDPDGSSLTEKSFAEHIKVMFTPTLVFLDGNGEQALRLNGYYPPEKFVLALDYASGKAGKGQTFSEFMARATPVPASGKLQSEPFFLSPPYQLARNRIAANRPLLVLFEQKVCSACDELHRDVLRREDTRRWLDRFDVVQLDLHSNEPLVTPSGTRSTGREWARKMNVQYAPSLVFFDERGKEVFRTEAWLRAFHMQTVLEYVATGAYKKEPSFQRFVQARADAMRERGERVDLME